MGKFFNKFVFFFKTAKKSPAMIAARRMATNLRVFILQNFKKNGAKSMENVPSKIAKSKTNFIEIFFHKNIIDDICPQKKQADECAGCAIRDIQLCRPQLGSKAYSWSSGGCAIDGELWVGGCTEEIIGRSERS